MYTATDKARNSKTRKTYDREMLKHPWLMRNQSLKEEVEDLLIMIANMNQKLKHCKQRV